jgi:hypothetical protein
VSAPLRAGRLGAAIGMSAALVAGACSTPDVPERVDQTRASSVQLEEGDDAAAGPTDAADQGASDGGDPTDADSTQCACDTASLTLSSRTVRPDAITVLDGGVPPAFLDGGSSCAMILVFIRSNPPCPFCQRYEQSLSQLPGCYQIIEIPTESNQDLLNQLGITLLGWPTTAIVVNGQVVASRVGCYPSNLLQTWITSSYDGGVCGCADGGG